jgi:hypothetical protein
MMVHFFNPAMLELWIGRLSFCFFAQGQKHKTLYKKTKEKRSWGCCSNNRASAEQVQKKDKFKFS